MADQIGAHVTICHDLNDDQVAALLALRVAPPIRIQIGRIRCWGEPAGGIYLEVHDTHHSLAMLRGALTVDPSGMPFTPHVTITHPRTTPPEKATAAWADLSVWEVNVDIEIDSIDVIEHSGRRWESAGQISLTQPRRS